MTRPRDRATIEQSHKWNPAELFPDEEAWERAADRVDDSLTDLEPDGVTSDAETLADALEAYFERRIAFERLSVYASLRTSVDATDERARELSGRASDLETGFDAVRSRIESEIQGTERDEIERLLAESERLARYEHYLEDLLRRAERTAEPAVEAALAALGPALSGSDRYATILNADFSPPTVERPDGEPVEVTLDGRSRHLRDPDRAFRRAVHDSFHDAISEHRHAIAGTFEDHVEAAVRTARLRGYDSSLEAALDGENVPIGVYSTLTETVRNRLGPLHEHLRRKREHLGVEHLRPWDVEVRLADAAPTVPYEDAKGYVVEAVAPLGAGFQSRLARGLESGWVDVYETPGKTAGAFAIPAYGTHPWVLLNYGNDVASLFALAHEAGHAMHAELASESQPMVYGYFDRFVSEIPSTLVQALLAAHLREADDPALRRAVRAAWLECLRGLVYRRTRWAICERRIHRHVEDGERLTAARLDRCVLDGWREFYAPVELDDRIAREWTYARHLNAFDEPFFVYGYATGVSAALVLAERLREEAREGGPGRTAERYRRFLRAGSSAYPLDLVADAGVDLASPEPVDRAVDAYRELLAEVDAARA